MPTADELLGAGVLAQLIDVLEGVVPGHPFAALHASVAALGPLALRQRSDLLKDALLSDLPGTPDELDAVVRAAMADPRFTGWMIWPVTEAVTARALQIRAALDTAAVTSDGRASAGATERANEAEHANATEPSDETEPPDETARSDETVGSDAKGRVFDDALALLRDLTGRLTAEFALRPLLQADLERALPIILNWTQSGDEHVRRLASEGTRSFLPWAKRVPALVEQPASTAPILHALYRDESEYVRRSVANHVNDLSRQSPDLAAQLAAEWMLAPDDNTPKLVRHALRSLIKKGHPATLALFGYAPGHGVVVSGPHLAPQPRVAIGGELPFTVTLENPTDRPARLVVDYVVHHRKANGAQTTKVFKLTSLTLDAHQSLTLTRRHSFKRITTRTYHPGPHAIEVQVNGTASGRADFELLAD